MKIFVFDTYVKARDSHIMHFDVFLPENDPEKAVRVAKEWLASIGEQNSTVTSRECRYCHSEEASGQVAEQITNQGYFIFRMEGCPT